MIRLINESLNLMIAECLAFKINEAVGKVNLATSPKNSQPSQI